MADASVSTARIALIVCYNGTAFHGFQYQNESLPTVQLALETVLSRVADRPVKLVCAGRTDTGVHATHQVVHFDTDSVRPDKAWVLGANSWLPDTISVSWGAQVAADFDARFSAVARRYLYLIYNSAVRSALLPAKVTREARPLDAAAMDTAGNALLGEHDFSSFRAAECQARTPVRRVDRLDVYRRGDMVVVDITANAFLHHMVRNIAGVLIDIGAGVAPEDWAARVLAERDRTKGSMTAPADGLYLVDVIYPARFGIPAGPDLPHLYSLFST